MLAERFKLKSSGDVQALGVSAESDGLEPTRTESRPFGDFGGGLALSWWSILLICLSGILLLGIASRIWRKRTQRLLRSLMAIFCRNPRYSQFKDVRLLPLLFAVNNAKISRHDGYG